MLYVNEILDRIAMQPIFVLHDDYNQLLGPTPEIQHKAMKVLIKQSLLNYERYDLWDQLRTINMSSGYYKFEAVITDDEETTFPIPKMISYVKTGAVGLGTVNPWGQTSLNALTGDYGTSFSARLWRYHKPIFEAQYSGRLLLRTLSNRPYELNDTADNKFTDDSRIWDLDIDNLNFYNVLYRNVLKHIKDIKDSVSASASVQFLSNIDSEINRLDNEIDQYVRTNCKGMNLWRK